MEQTNTPLDLSAVTEIAKNVSDVVGSIDTALTMLDSGTGV